MTYTLLKLSTFDKSIFWYGGEGYIILGILGILLGLLVGWSVWRTCRTQADNMEKSNKQLREVYRRVQFKKEQINSVIDEL